MSDDTLHPDPGAAGELLASQYVDGLTSADESAQVESSPELRALAARFRDQREALAQVPPASDAARDAAVAAALSQFSMVAPPPNVVSIDRRRRTRWLTAAAAVVLLGVGGIAVANLSSGGDDTTAGVQNLGVETAKNDTADPLSGAGTTRVGEPGMSAVTGETAVGDTATSAAGTGGGAPPEATIGSIDGPSVAVPVVSSPAGLRTFSATDQPVEPSFVFPCTLDDTQVVVGEISWKGTPAVVVRDTVTGVITALDAQCTALATVEP